MDGVILAAGAGTRMRPLTLSTPKPLLQLQGKPILAWSLRSLRDLVDRVIIVVSYRKSQIESYMASQRIFDSYAIVEQLPAALGTGHALACCQSHLRGEDFVVVNGDDLYSRAALRDLCRRDFAILSAMRHDFHHFGVIQRDVHGHFRDIDEKPPRARYPSPQACSIGAYKLRSEIFDYPIEKSERGEYEISETVSRAARSHAVAVVDSPFWLPIGDPAALASAQHVDLSPVTQIS